ncbi:class E sortase [Streptomyces globosus]|uniref:class E sortase n=1 Tax=Streptomyces globosus TaxID=68209 RepID=UPI0015776814|nr:class E sortase [Streptomyces globosus]
MTLIFVPRAAAALVAGAATAVLAACSPDAAARPAVSSAGAGAATAAGASLPTASGAVAATPTPSPSVSAAVPKQASVLGIPSVGISGLRVVPYEGTTDDAPGTRIQDRGVAASPYGERGGVGPGQVGNFLVTAHRLSAGGPLRDLPSVKPGAEVHVTLDGVTYTYEITATRSTSFRSERSLAEQRAAVPGAPGRAPTQAMITISTCATPEDDAAGNFWRDPLGNPEHRIDKVGVLRRTAPADAPAG